MFGQSKRLFYEPPEIAKGLILGKSSHKDSLKKFISNKIELYSEFQTELLPLNFTIDACQLYIILRFFLMKIQRAKSTIMMFDTMRVKNLRKIKKNLFLS